MPSSPKNWVKTISLIFLGLILSFFTLILLVPTFLSTEWGQKEITKLLNERISGKLEFKKLHLNLFSGQRVEGFVLKDSLGGELLSVASFSTEESLFDLLLNRTDNPKIQLVGLNTRIQSDPSGTTNLSLALDPPTESPVTIAPNSLKIELIDVNASISYSTLPKPISIHLTGKTKQDHQIGFFDVDAYLADFTFEELRKAGQNPKHLLQLQQDAKIRLNVEGSNIPVSLLDQLLASQYPELSGVLLKSLGEKLDLRIKQNPNKENLEVGIDAKAPLFSANLVLYLSPSHLQIKNAAGVDWTVTPELFDELNRLFFSHLNLKLNESSKAQMRFSELSLPFKGDSSKKLFDYSALALEGNIVLSQAGIQGPPSFGHLIVQKMNAKFSAPADGTQINVEVDAAATQNGHPFQLLFHSLVDKRFKFHRYPPSLEFDLRGFPVVIIEELSKNDGTLSKALGTHVDSTILAVNDKDNLHLEFKINSKLHENLLSGSFSGHYIDDDWFEFSSPIALLYHLTPQALRDLNIIKDPSYKTLATTPIALTVKPTKINLNNLTWNTLQLEGDIKLHDLAVLQHPDFGTAAIKEITIPWSIDAKSDRIDVAFAGETDLMSQTTGGSLSGQVSIKNWLVQGMPDFESANFILEGEVNRFPVTLLEAVINKPNLSQFLGETLDINLQGHVSFSQTYPGSIKASFNGKQLRGSSSFAIDKLLTIRTHQTPTTIEFILTPERFATLRKAIGEQSSDDGLVLGDSASAVLTINELKLPFHTSLLLTDVGVDAHLKIDKFAVLEIKKGSSMTFEKVETSIQSDALAKKILVNIDGIQKNDSLKSSRIQVKAQLENLFTSDNTINIPHLALHADATFKQFPSSMICQLICLSPALKEKVEVLFGERVDLALKTRLKQLSGPIDLQVSGPTGNVSMNAALSKGVLTLTNDFTANFHQTPRLAQTLLQDILPLAGDLIAAESPLQIRISPIGFMLPLFPFDFFQTQIGSAMLGMGKVQFSTEGQVGEILSLLKPEGANQISMWFTPLYFSLQKGALHLQRIDMLVADAYPVATWGKVDFEKDKINMVIGLTGKALSYAFKIKNLESNYMLQLPYKGQIGRASIDKRKATARISALVAQSQGGPQGLVLGTVLHIASGGLTEDSPPAPTTTPLPWEEVIEDASQPEPPKKKSKVNAVEELKSDAKKILKSIFEN
jgi:hypothetical protein